MPKFPLEKRLHEYGPLAITWLLRTPADQIHRYELAEMNLVCAFGLPGTKDMNIAAMLTLLETWVKGASAHIAKASRLFHKQRSQFDGSLARFRIKLLLHYLTTECGIHYNPERITDPDNFDDPADSFIHGLLGPRRTGTCASLPVLITAIGRKLGFPLKLVQSPAHCFCRWDSPQERFNIEYHEKGLNIHPDEYYEQGPYKLTAKDCEHHAKNPAFLQSMTPQQDLALFVHTRACQLEIAGRLREALTVMNDAHLLWPARRYGVWVNHLMTKVLYPEKNFPNQPCEETVGEAAIQRAMREKGIGRAPLE